ncbi:hypothetical protein N1032_14650 [Herbiconiux sp. CPCC 203386]|uniref:Uncharacterized protein n=1 Tax=Herbiconiux daphne TaxID=2970914 RepID=A0ABT2H4X6_9MICO|nr:hypothetical protein [Herbiconiux daphne]MCS5734982.1 hypothetical protein [Herbiconiux daphne]
MNGSPASARSIVPRNVLPICAGSRWVYRTPSVDMIVMKSTPVASMIATA